VTSGVGVGEGKFPAKRLNRLFLGVILILCHRHSGTWEQVPFVVMVLEASGRRKVDQDSWVNTALFHRQVWMKRRRWLGKNSVLDVDCILSFRRQSWLDYFFKKTTCHNSLHVIRICQKRNKHFFKKSRTWLKFAIKNKILSELTKSMELSTTRESTSCGAIKYFPSTLWNPKVHHRIHKSSLLVSILNQTNPGHATLSYLSKILIF
jgi:hypothetical protein